MAVLGTGTWFLVEYMGEQRYSAWWIAYWNAAVRGGFFLVVAVLLSRTRYLTTHLERLVQVRTAALDQEVAHRRRVEREIAEIHHWEQTRIAHELHDQLGASLAGVAFRSKAIAENLERRSQPEASESRLVTDLVNSSINQVRSLARLLAPADDPGGIGVALSRLGSEMETLFGITCLIEAPKGLPRLLVDQARQLYRIAQEASRNAVKHAGAQLIRIRLGVEGEHLLLTISSDGRPWAPDTGSGEGLGLRIMQYRAGVLGGSLVIEPGVPEGTTVRCRMPLASPDDPGVLPGAGDRTR